MSLRASNLCFSCSPTECRPQWRSLGQTSIRAELASGELPTTRVRRISQCSRSMTLLARMRVQCSLGKSKRSQGLLDAVLHLTGRLLQLHGTLFFYHSPCLSPGSFLVLLGVDRLEHFSHQLHLGARSNREHIAVEMDSVALVLGLRE